MASSVPANLSALPLEHIIGAPMNAAIKAQVMAARETVNFINGVGMNVHPVTGEKSAINVDFKFDRPIEELVSLPGVPEPVRNIRVVPSKLSVPLLSIVPIPYIRIEDLTIQFEYSIADIETSESSSELGIEAGVEVNYWAVKASVKGSYSNKNKNTRSTDQRTTLSITVHAVQDSIPEGLARVLDMMNDQLQVVPLSTGTLTPAATARIDSVSPILGTAGTTELVVELTGSGLRGATKATVSGEGVTAVLQNSPLNPAEGQKDVTSAELKVSIPSQTKPGERTITLLTPQGEAATKFVVMP
ncbi:DUF2589 domain-containing protein [Streptomyces sp. NPDC051018]|uniref:DUF2589 domain-containing protein n=1 Tax=Streptomyces sp. NPDC051018 TaxID=3365639 RepID=UPI003799A0E3